MSVARGQVRQERGRTSYLMVAPFLEVAGIDYCKTFSSLVESYDEVVKHDRRFVVPVAFQSEREATSVMEDIYMEFELVGIQVGIDSFGQARGRLVTALLSIRNQ